MAWNTRKFLLFTHWPCCMAGRLLLFWHCLATQCFCSREDRRTQREYLWHGSVERDLDMERDLNLNFLWKIFMSTTRDRCKCLTMSCSESSAHLCSLAEASLGYASSNASTVHLTSTPIASLLRWTSSHTRPNYNIIHSACSGNAVAPLGLMSRPVTLFLKNIYYSVCHPTNQSPTKKFVAILLTHS